MPRKVSDDAVNYQQYGEVHNELPPSTMAAQLVQNHLKDDKRSQLPDRVNFRQLLEELRTLSSVDKTDVQSNLLLITVIAQAGLDPTRWNDLFNKNSNANDDVLASLEIIELVVGQNPEVLFIEAQDTNQSGSPLCLLLLPRVLALLSPRCANSDILEKVAKLLSSMVLILQRDPTQWTASASLLCLYRTCVDDALAALERSSPSSDTVSDLILPSPEARFIFPKTAQAHVALREGSQVSIVTPPHAVDIIQCLLTSIINVFLNESSIWQSTTNQDSWSLATLDRFEVELHRRAKDSWLDPEFLAVLLAPLGMLESLLLGSSHREVHNIILRKTFLLFVRILQRILLVPFAAFSEELQERVAVCLQRVVMLITRFPRLYYEARGFIFDSLAHLALDISKAGTCAESLSAALENLLSAFSSAPSITALPIRRSRHRLPNCPSAHAKDHLPAAINNQAIRPFRKRRRIQNPSDRPDAQSTESLDKLCEVVGMPYSQDLGALCNGVAEFFSCADEDKRNELLMLLIKMPCIPVKNARYANNAVPLSDCGCGQVSAADILPHWTDAYKHFHGILAKLVERTNVHELRVQRVLLTIAIGRYVAHTRKQSTLDLTQSTLGNWCLQGLRSSSREFRIAAGQALPGFLRISTELDERIPKKNRVIALDFLRKLAELDDIRQTETIIVTLGQIADVCGDEELEIVLLQLVDFLGHTNPFVCGLADVELRRLGHELESGLEVLLRPFWRTIGVTALKDLLTRPQKAQQLCDLLGWTVNRLLTSTQAETVPYLVLCGKRDVLKRIAHARGNETTVWNICMQPRNLSAILSTLIAQNPTDVESFLALRLATASPEFENEDIANLLRVDKITVACEVLKAVGDIDGENRSQVLQGFYGFANILAPRTSATRGVVSKDVAAGLFFEHNSLGIMASFSNVIDNPTQSWLEKRRCLRGIEVMIIAAGSKVTTALPQIKACLQSAFDSSELRDDAFSAWSKLPSIPSANEDLRDLVEQTFTMVVQNWDRFASSTQHKAHELILDLLTQNNSMIEDMVVTLPSLASIPLLSKTEAQLQKRRAAVGVSQHLTAFGERCRNESSAVVLQALRELLPYLNKHQKWIHDAAITEQPDPTIATLLRSLLDVCTRYSQEQNEISELCTQCMGIVGCLDPTKIEAVRETSELIILSNFETSSEAVGFVTFLFEKVLAKAFLSVTNPRAQGFLAYAMQELLKFCGFKPERMGSQQVQMDGDDLHKRWMSMPKLVRNTLTPFLSSAYTLATQAAKPPPSTYPLYTPTKSHSTWLRDLVFDLALKCNGDNARQIFKVLSRITRGFDISIASFLLPYVATNIIIGGTTRDVQDLTLELIAVLNEPPPDISALEKESLKLCSESVFSVLDYLSRWLQDKKKQFAAAQSLATRSGKHLTELETETSTAQILNVESVLKSIAPEVISRRAVQCGSYARALFHWEQYMRDRSAESPTAADREAMYQRLLQIYTQIDEPDGIDGISSFCHMLSPDQQVMDHRRAGRWAPAQSWYEAQLGEQPLNVNYHLDLLNCLREAGQHHMILDHLKVLPDMLVQEPEILSVASEAAWNTTRWDDLAPMLRESTKESPHSFNVGMGIALGAIRSRDSSRLSETLRDVRFGIAKSCSFQTTSSLQACHQQLLKLQALYEVEIISGMCDVNQQPPQTMTALLDHRLEILGSCLSDKQYLLSIRRAAMQLSALLGTADVSSSFMVSAKLSRKGNHINLAYQAVLQAARLGDESSKVEQARLLWKEGEHKKAIKNLEGLITSGAFNLDHGSTKTNQMLPDGPSMSTLSTIATGGKQNLLAARAHLLLAKWLDQAGQSQASTVNAKYQDAQSAYKPWEKSYYYLGRYYNKILEVGKTLPLSRQTLSHLSGEVAKLVVENYLRSLTVGSKYIFETLPKLLTLWLDAGAEISRPYNAPDTSTEFRKQVNDLRPKHLDAMNKQVRKYMDRIPAYIFYTALSQMITRISHANQKVYELLAAIITRVVMNHPQQALWSLLATVKSSASDRSARGVGILAKISSRGKNIRSEGSTVDLKNLIAQAQKLSDHLLRACEARVPDARGTIYVSLSKDLGFNVKTAPCPLVVPLAKTLAASIPVIVDGIRPKGHKAFPSTRDAVTIQSFEDEVMVLGSLQRPRKLTVRGSDGNRYGLLCKPADDLRKDQRLMEFNAVINRSLKKDAEASRRRLYIRTYAVTPLNEACGLIEWVDGLKPMRDIVVALYRQKNISLDYTHLKDLLNDACSRADGHSVFTQTILPMYKPVLHEWFTEVFPTPESWFAARLRYTRSCAVSSMVGHALGLGDRHGENLLLEESTGGIFHVDFNCLFDKGLTFDKPELVPFRLTHNMVDAFGAYGVEGPFRRSAELAMRIMRAKEDALLTILETFVYDPTADFVGQPRKRTSVYEVPTTPREVLESVKNKVNGLLRGESVPLSVEGHVDALIGAARDPKNLCRMYIGWCAFF